MQLEAMSFTQHPVEASIPETITVTFTAQEMAYVATLIGKQTDLMANEIMPGGSSIQSHIWDVLTGEVANRFFKEGLEEMVRVVSK